MNLNSRGNLLIAVLFAILFFAGCSLKKAAQSSTKADKDNFHIFILMGQSNMSGYGHLEKGDSIPVPNVFKIPTLYNGPMQWEAAAHPLHNRLKSDRFGLGLPFAEKYLKNNKGVSVGLIPVAYGGANIQKLGKGSKVYDDFLEKIAFAKKRGVIKGLLWHQGESDTVDEEKANNYEAMLTQLINDVRNDAGDENLPVVVGNLAEFYGTSPEHNVPDRLKRINKVRQALKDLPKKISNVGFVETAGCTSIDSHYVHFDRKSYIILGNRYYDAFNKLKK